MIEVFPEPGVPVRIYRFMQSSDEMFQQHERARVRWKSLQAAGVGLRISLLLQLCLRLWSRATAMRCFERAICKPLFPYVVTFVLTTQSQKLVRILCTTNAEMKVPQ